MEYKETIDKALQPHLQKEVILSIQKKPLKTGKLILYNFHDFHIELALACNNKIKKALLPLPFTVHFLREKNIIYFDYRVKSIFSKFKPLETSSRFYDDILEIKFI